MTHDECGMKLIPEYCGGLTKNLELSKLVVIYNYNYNYNYKLIKHVPEWGTPTTGTSTGNAVTVGLLFEARRRSAVPVVNEWWEKKECKYGSSHTL
jgi:hypothetical protein